MVGVFDFTILEQEIQRMGKVMALLRPLTRPRVAPELQIEPSERSSNYEIHLADISVADFRYGCSWE